MSRAYREGVRAVEVTVSANVKQGDLALEQGFFGIVQDDALSGANTTLDIRKNIEIETSQIETAEAFDTKGAPVYWKAATRKLSLLASYGTEPVVNNTLVGRLLVPKDAAGVIHILPL